MKRLLAAMFGCAMLIGCAGRENDTAERSTGGCYIGGCSSQLCSDDDDLASTCEWTDAYACYDTATCERQATGECGWTETPALKQCLADA